MAKEPDKSQSLRSQSLGHFYFTAALSPNEALPESLVWTLINLYSINSLWNGVSNKTTTFIVKFLKFYHFTVYFSNQQVVEQVDRLPAFAILSPVVFGISYWLLLQVIFLPFSGHYFHYLILDFANLLELGTTSSWIELLKFLLKAHTEETNLVTRSCFDDRCFKYGPWAFFNVQYFSQKQNLFHGNYTGSVFLRTFLLISIF